MPTVSATAFRWPMSTNTPSVLYVNGFGLPAPSAAATFPATVRPWRSACWQVGGVGWPRRAGSGTAAASPIAHTSSRPSTLQKRSTTIRPVRSSGSPSFSTTGAGRTPAVQATVRQGTTSPSDSSTESSEMRSTVVEVRTSTPRRRSSAVANAARSAEISGMTRSRASTRMKRRPCTRARG